MFLKRLGLLSWQCLFTSPVSSRGNRVGPVCAQTVHVSIRGQQFARMKSIPNGLLSKRSDDYLMWEVHHRSGVFILVCFDGRLVNLVSWRIFEDILTKLFSSKVWVWVWSSLWMGTLQEGVSFAWRPNGMGFCYGEVLIQSATHSWINIGVCHYQHSPDILENHGCKLPHYAYVFFFRNCFSKTSSPS